MNHMIRVSQLKLSIPHTKEQLEKNGLCCVLTHTKPEKMLADPQKVAEEHSVFGCSYIGLGGMPGL